MIFSLPSLPTNIFPSHRHGPAVFLTFPILRGSSGMMIGASRVAWGNLTPTPSQNRT
jgi:hypothetical protein